MQHQPGLPRQGVPLRLRLQRAPAMQLNALAKIDLVKKTVKNWHDEDGAAAPSEPLFVARPGATSEDDGQFI